MKSADIDRVFGRGRLQMVTGTHVEVFREEAGPGERRRYTKRFLSTAAGDFRHWTEREWRILARLVGHGIGPVPDVVQFDRGVSGGKVALVQTYDAGITVDHWATLLPVQRDGAQGEQRLRHVFEDCAHWWALARHCLIALDAIHELGLVHLDLKADNVCVPFTPADFDPRAPGQALVPLLVPHFEQIALIDFAFSLVSGEQLLRPLPIARQTEYDYQSPRLLAALEAGAAGDLGPTRALDWRCDFFSLAAMLRRYLPDPEAAPAQGWTRARDSEARSLVRRLLLVHDAELPLRRPHAELFSIASLPLADPALKESLARGWQLALRDDAVSLLSPTPVTRIAMPVVEAATRITSPVTEVMARIAAPAVVESAPEAVERAPALDPGFITDLRELPQAPGAQVRAKALAQRRPKLLWGAGLALAALLAIAALGDGWRGLPERGSAPRDIAVAAVPAVPEPASAPTAATPPAPTPPSEAASAASASAAPPRVIEAAEVPAPSAPSAAVAAAVAAASAPVVAAAKPPAAMPQPARPRSTAATSAAPATAPAPAPTRAQARAAAAEARASARNRAVAPTRVAASAPRPAAAPVAGNRISAAEMAAAVRAGALLPRTPPTRATASSSSSMLAARTPAPAPATLPPRAPPTLPPPPSLSPPPTQAVTLAAAPPATVASRAATLPAIAAAVPATLPAPAPVAPTPRDPGARAEELIARQLPRTTQRAERLVLRVLVAASDAQDDDELRSAARALRLAPADPLFEAGSDAAQARSLNESARASFRRGDLAEAVALQTRAFGANPLDAEVAGNLAILRLKQQPERADIARQLALHALTTPDSRYPYGRLEDWTTLAIANALTGRERDARNAWLVALELAPQADRQCRAAVNAYATYGERVRPGVEALLYRASRQRGERAAICEWPPH